MLACSRLKLPTVVGGAEADPVTEMLVSRGWLITILPSAWCTMVGATASRRFVHS